MTVVSESRYGTWKLYPDWNRFDPELERSHVLDASTGELLGVLSSAVEAHPTRVPMLALAPDSSAALIGWCGCFLLGFVLLLQRA